MFLLLNYDHQTLRLIVRLANVAQLSTWLIADTTCFQQYVTLLTNYTAELSANITIQLDW